MIKLSIITVNLNNPIGLKVTLESIFSQTYNSFETIIIDGGSEKDSLDIISEYNDSITYWVSEPDSGIYHGMNKGINKANGEYCFFLNSGDALLGPDVLKHLFNENFNEDIIQGNLIVSEEAKIVGMAKGKEQITFIDVLGSIIKHQGSIIKKELFSKYGLYNQNLKLIADYEFFLKSVGLGTASYRYIDLDIAIYDNCGASNSNPALVKEEKEWIMKNYIHPLMIPEFEFLLKYRKIKVIDRYSISRFFLRTFIKINSILCVRSEINAKKNRSLHSKARK